MILELDTIKPIIKPVLKWVGGKRELLPELRKIYTSLEFKNYYELFVGGGSVYLDIVNLFGEKITKSSVINDVNYDLIEMYKHIKNDPDEIISNCKTLENEFYKHGYYHIRDRFNGIDRSGVEVEKYKGVTRSSSLILLNRTCFNGLYRTNKKGLFNVPEGKYKNPKIVDENNLFLLSNILPIKENITNKNFNEVEGISNGDFVYMDPPYHPLTETSSFTDYSGEFGSKEQIKLRDYFKELDEKGVFVLQSNSSSKFIQEIYSDFKIVEVDCSRNINSNGGKRGKVKEYLILGNTLNRYYQQ
jgi:DNA adenine methylase